MQHFHVRPELFYQSFDNCLSWCCRWNSYTFGSYFLTSILEIISHDTVKLEILHRNQKLKNSDQTDAFRFHSHLIRFRKRKQIKPVGIPLTDYVSQGFLVPPLAILWLHPLTPRQSHCLKNQQSHTQLSTQTQDPPYLSTTLLNQYTNNNPQQRQKNRANPWHRP